MMISNKKWIGLFSACAVLGIIARFADYKIATLLYRQGNIVGSVCEHIIPMLWFYLCGFACAILLFHRNTHTTRAKNQILNVVYATLSVAAVFAGTYFPFRNTVDKPYLVIVITTIVAAACLIYASYSWFKRDFQKRIISKAAGVLLASGACTAAVCSLNHFLPTRKCYYDILQAGQYDYLADVNVTSVKFFCFAAASGARLLWLNYFAQTVPNIRHGAEKIFVATVAVDVVIAVGLVSTGHFYLSEVIYGMLVGYFSLFVFSKISERRSKK